MPGVFPHRPFLGAIAVLALAGLSHAQEQRREVQAIVRISRTVIDELADDNLEAVIPFHTEILGFDVEGTATGRGRLNVKLIADADDALFIVTGEGVAEGYAVGRRPHLIASGPIRTTFRVRKVVRFDGRRFTGEKTETDAPIEGELEYVSGSHPGCCSKLIGCLAMPIGEQLVPRAEHDAKPIAEWYLTRFVNEEANELLRELNETTPIEETIRRLFPKTQDWIVRLETNDEYVQAAWGPRDSVIPKLEHPKRPANARIELWVKTTREEARFLEMLSKWNLANDLLRKRLEESHPGITKLAEDATVTAIGNWIVIAIGNPAKK